MTLSTVQWTIEDYHRMIDAGILDDRPVELLNGEIVKTAPEGEPHAHGSTEVRDYLIALLGDRVKVRDSKPITIWNSNSEPAPDIAVVQPLGREYRQRHPYPENVFWLIEFSDSSLTRDLEHKSKIYAEANISEYWMVNLRKMRLVVFRSPIDGAYTLMQTLEDGTISPMAFPDVQISIGQLLNP